MKWISVLLLRSMLVMMPVLFFFLFLPHTSVFACDTSGTSTKVGSCEQSCSNGDVWDSFVKYSYKDGTSCTQKEYFLDSGCTSPGPNLCPATCTSDAECGAGTCASGSVSAASACSGDKGSWPWWCQGYTCGYSCDSSTYTCNAVRPPDGLGPYPDAGSCATNCKSPTPAVVTNTPAPLPTVAPGDTCDPAYCDVGTSTCDNGNRWQMAQKCTKADGTVYYKTWCDTTQCAINAVPTPTPGGPGCQAFVTKCNSSADCNGGVCDPNYNPWTCTTCSAPPLCTYGTLDCNSGFKISDYRLGNKVQTIGGVSQQQNGQGWPIPVLTIDTGDVVQFSSSIFPGNTGTYEATWLYNASNPLASLCREVGTFKDSNTGTFDFCSNFVQDNDYGTASKTDVDYTTDVKSHAIDRNQRKIFGTPGTYTYQLEQQYACNGHPNNNNNRCLVTVQVNKLACGEDFCNALQTGTPNCFESSKDRMTRAQGVFDIAHYYLYILKDPAWQAAWVQATANQAAKKSWYTDVPYWRGDFKEIETARLVGWMNNPSINFYFAGKSTTPGTDSFKPEDDWKFGFHGISWGEFYNGKTNDNYLNEWLVRGEYRRYLMQYMKDKGQDAGVCTSSLKYNVSGTVYIDYNHNGIVDGSDTPYTAGTPLVLNPGNQGTVSSATGTYQYAVVNGTYTVTVTVPAGYQIVGATTKAFTINNANYPTPVNFFITPDNYTVSGSVFLDNNKNTIRDGGEPNYTASASVVTLSGPSGTFTSNNATGNFAFGGLISGRYTVTYSSVPTGYNLTWPQSGNFYYVYVGKDPEPGKTCADSVPVHSPRVASDVGCGANDSVINANFGISNANPWIQGVDLNFRFDLGFSTPIPPAASINPSCGGANAIVGTETPGIVFTGLVNPIFGAGQASVQKWIVGGFNKPFQDKAPFEHSPNRTTLATEYNFLLSKAQQSSSTISIDPVTLSSGTCTNCLSSLSTKVYLVNGNFHITGLNSIPTGRNIVILVNGNVTIGTSNPLDNTQIAVANGSTLLIATTQNIIIDNSVGSTTPACGATTQLDGIYSADGSVVVQGNNDCRVGADKMLSVGGNLIANADLTGSEPFRNNRDLCAANLSFPAVRVRPRVDFLLNLPQLLRVTTNSYKEVAP